MDGSAPTTRRPEDGIEYLEGPTGARRRGGWGTLLGIAWTILFPWLGPAGYWLTLGRARSDFWELTGVLLWPAVFCLVGVYFAQLDREHARGVAGDGPGIDWALKAHAGLSAASLVALAVFEGGMVVTTSIYRWNRDERHIAVYLLKLCLVVYVAHVVFAFLARHALRRTGGPTA